MLNVGDIKPQAFSALACSVAPVTTSNSVVTVYWHTLECTSASEVKPLEGSKDKVSAGVKLLFKGKNALWNVCSLVL